MNNINMLGRLANDAKSFSVMEDGTEKQMLSFSVLDFGTSGKNEPPMILEVHFIKDVGVKLLPYLKKGKDVYIHGFMAHKKYVTTSGVEKEKFYISADYICFTGASPKEEREAA